MSEQEKDQGLEAKIEQWKTQYAPSGVAVLKTPLGTMVFRPAETDEYGSWLDRCARDASSKAAAFLELAQSCVLHPELSEAKRIFAKLPALPAAAGSAIVKLSGGGFEAEVKKP